MLCICIYACINRHAVSIVSAGVLFISKQERMTRKVCIAGLTRILSKASFAYLQGQHTPVCRGIRRPRHAQEHRRKPNTTTELSLIPASPVMHWLQTNICTDFKQISALTALSSSAGHFPRLPQAKPLPRLPQAKPLPRLPQAKPLPRLPQAKPFPRLPQAKLRLQASACGLTQHVCSSFVDVQHPPVPRA